MQSRHLYTAVACHEHSAATITQKLSHSWFAIHAFMHTLQNSFLYMVPHAAMDVTHMHSSHSPGINIAHAYPCSLLIIMWQCMLMCFLCLRATLTSLVYTETIQIDGLLRIAGTTRIAGAAEYGWVRTANVSNLS